MIKINELRVNNIHKNPPSTSSVCGWRRCKVNGKLYARITAFGIYLISENEIEIDPIDITREWIISFGFKPFCKDFSKRGIIIHTRKRGFVINKKIPIIKHVHQLQNLYFALTGEELTITSDNA